MRIRKHDANEDPDARGCHICGGAAPLTFEHVPPRSSYNDGRAEMLGLEAWLGRDAEGRPGARGTILQRGSGAYSLCATCNQRAGRLYVPELAKWTRVGMQVLYGDGVAARFADEPRPSYVTLEIGDVRPGRLMKQIATMMLAISSPAFARSLPDLQRYARDPDVVGVPDNLQFYLVLYSGPWARFVGGAARVRGIAEDDCSQDNNPEGHFVVEVAYPPYAYVMSVDEETPALETGNITGFGDLRITQRAERAEVQLLNGYGSTALPLDYRTRAAVARDHAAGLAADAG